MDDQKSQTCSPRLVASTGDIYQASITESQAREEAALNGAAGNGVDYRSSVKSKTNRPSSNVFRSVEWIADGTTLLAVSEDNCVRTFIAPPDLLTSPTVHPLLPYSISPLPSTPYCISPYPFASLSNPSAAVFLTSLHSHPIQLRSLLYPHITGTYPLIHTETEKYLIPYSLAWTPYGTHFLAGTDSQIHLFDVSRANQGPIETYTTGKKRKKSSSANRQPDESNVRGIVSSLAIHPETHALAAGTYSRRVLLYSSPWQDAELLASINLNNTAAALPSLRKAGLSNSNSASHTDVRDAAKGGGVTSLSFTTSGMHLLIAERKSGVLHIYDLRDMTQPYALLTGREALNNQKIGASIGLFADSPDMVVSGGNDGIVRAWEPFASAACDTQRESEGGIFANLKEWRAAEDPVTAAAVHPSGSVVATSSGQRKRSSLSSAGSDRESDESNDDSDGDGVSSGVWDNAIRIWAL
ncbi:hypothetical protein DRE_00837 [Drechslerella stenobrocha 248]|uniref:Anaphase-promoting complex subunit 4 WD40 domain-containing protein n=1 Tax=Drechslerella stenobrocha 248 TaxID=1043628 RepID=W7HZS1_9PEZI|nr:hypothetical protein DRE_00837 [Drechslerella stenobrocha 248]